ncbi:MAG: hypothetical protein SFV54_11605 [Bryobacteraceae bacterium]|nr:hypothetical protein [Bryobacteraceae bacterium]
MQPVGAAVGQPVTVNARIRNKSAVAGKAVVRLFQGHPEWISGQQLGTTTVSVPANGTAVASWTVKRPAGDPNFWVSLDDVYPRDIGPGDNLATRNVYLKAIIDTGRRTGYGDAGASYPAIGDLMGTGQPVVVFSEFTALGTPNAESRVTALQVFSDGTSRELWSITLLPAPSEALAPAIADIDGDGLPEIIVEAVTRGPAPGQVHVFALNRDGTQKWSHGFTTVGRVSCHSGHGDSKPALGDMNGDGVVDVALLEQDFIVLDGRSGNELVRQPGIYGGCSAAAYSAIVDVTGDGKPEYIAGDYGIHVFNRDGTKLWERGGNNMFAFAVLDLEKDGTPEIVLPVHRQFFYVLDGPTGAIRKQTAPSNTWSPFAWTIAATSSLDPQNFPTLAIANNDYANGTGSLDRNIVQRWFDLTPAIKLGNSENPTSVVLADLLGQGRPQVIARSDRRLFGIQDLNDGSYLEHMGIYGFGSTAHWPIPVDVDGDGRGEVVVSYGTGLSGYNAWYEPYYPGAQFLIFGSDQWKKLPTTWNQFFFVPGQVDEKLAFRHDYQPWKTHNSWMQQPMRKPCDADYDNDVDSADIAAITAARGKTAVAGDYRDFDKDGVITVNDARACALRCTGANCAAINPPARILSVNPRRVFPGSTVTVTIRAEFMNFRQGQVAANFGAGVSVGAINVIDPDTATAVVTVAAGQTGDRTLTLTSGAVTASRPAVFSLSAGNLPPVVKAGLNQSLVLPGSLTLSGTVTDDGLPNNQLSFGWQVVAAPGTVTFGDQNSLATTVSFSNEGFYVLRLSATDGQYFSNSDIGITVIRGNTAPTVSAGPNLTVAQDAANTLLKGDVQDDGLPAFSKVTSQWAKVSGPGTVDFSAPAAPVTAAVFSAPGVYQLSLTATDGALSDTATVTVTVNPPAARIQSIAPESAAAGQSRTVVVTGAFTHFVQGTTQAKFGTGVSVGGGPAGGFGPVTVTGPNTAIAQIAVATGATLGPRAVTIATGAEQATKDNAFLVGTIGAPHSIRPNLSFQMVAPGESITAAPEVLDAAGNVIASPAAFTLTVVPKPGLTAGAAPVVNGLKVSFPKLVKRLRNHNLEIDPVGDFADGDPTDPNYGKETGGIYTLQLKLNGTAVTSATDVVVLPSGTAKITLNALKFGTDLAPALDEARTAVVSGDPAAIAIARSLLDSIVNTIEYSPRVLAPNHVLAPVNGFPLTYPQVTNLFPASPDDTAYGVALGSLAAQMRAIRARLDAIKPATLSQADVDAMVAAERTLNSIRAQLAALQPGPRGVTANTAQLNEILSVEMPRLFESINQKALELMAAAPGASVGLKDDGPRTLAAGSPGQYIDFMSTLFSVFTKLDKAAMGNIVELGISMVNNLVNIMLKDYINSIAPGGLAIDFVSAGGQFSFVCPNYMNTYVEGTGFSPQVNMNSMVIIGCVNSNLLKNLLTLSAPSDYAGAIRLFFKAKSIAEALGQPLGWAATQQPDAIREGLFGGSQLVWSQGWPRVNMGKIPCVGVVVVFNFETGAFQAVNANMLGECK